MSKYSDKVKRRMEDAAKKEERRTSAKQAEPNAPTARLTPSEQSERDIATHLEATKAERENAYVAVADALEKTASAVEPIYEAMSAACESLGIAYASATGLAKSEMFALLHMAECLRSQAGKIAARAEIAKAIAERTLAR